MEDRLNTAYELLQNDDKLSVKEREELWDLLKYVMTSPKADLVPAKKKLIDIKLTRATAWVREAIMELSARTIAEVIKG